MKQVRSQTTGKVLLIWDQASWHTSKQVQSFLEDLGRFETLRLPKRAPEANPMEDLWRELCKQVAACLERSLDATGRRQMGLFEVEPAGLQGRKERLDALPPAVEIHCMGGIGLPYRKDHERIARSRRMSPLHHYIHRLKRPARVRLG